MKLSPRFSRITRRCFFFIHLWTGVILGLWLVAIGLTGSVLAWPNLRGVERKWIIFPNPVPPPGTPQISLGQAIAAVKQAQPNSTAKQLSSIFPASPPAVPYYVFLRRGSVVLVDPYSARVSAPINDSRVIYLKIESLHIELIGATKGLITNGILSFFTLFLLLSGVWLWWPSTVRQLKIRLSVKRKTTLRRLVTDLHNVAGIYLFILLLITTATALPLVYNNATGDGIVKAINGQNIEKELTVVPHGQRLPDDVLFQRLHQQHPNIVATFIKRPVHPDDVYTVYFPRKEMGFFRGGMAEMDPYSGKILKMGSADHAPKGEKVMGVIEDLHVGDFGGVWVQILYTLAGLMPLGLFITGMLMWWKRKQAEWKARRRNPQSKTHL